ncbi:MAG: stage II sporulation protein R [Eubacteriales bacterium]
MKDKFREKVSKHKNKMILLIAMIIGAVLTGAVVYGLESEARERLLDTQESLAQEVLRFHVLANSDSTEDQALKLEVKDQVLTYMELSLGTEESVLLTKMWAENNIENLTRLCETTIQESGYDYTVNVTLAESYFPIKTYGDITFPEGEYEALKIEIGDANGENWWCCLYPNLCFIDATCGVVSEEGKENLQEVLTVDEYEMITTTTKYEIKWFFFSW